MLSYRWLVARRLLSSGLALAPLGCAAEPPPQPLAAVPAVAAVASAPLPPAPALAPPKYQLERAIARDAYVYGVPMIDEYRSMYAYSIDRENPQFKGPFNSVLNIARVFTPEDTAFVTPNSDTPYTMLGLDLRAEPIVLTIPSIEKNRYFVFQMLDLYTFNFDYLGTRTTGNGGGTFLIVGPRFHGEIPKGITKVIRAETDLVTVVGRTQLFNPGDLARVKKIQAGYKVQTLSAYTTQAAPPPAPAVEWLKPLSAEQTRSSLGFFNELAFLLQFAPTHPSETELRAQFAKIGIEPGKPFDEKVLPEGLRAQLLAGMADGQKAIDEKRAALGGKYDTLFGTRDFLHNDFLARAVGTQVGIGANSREEALYPMYEKDSAGQKLDGSHKYTLRFGPNGLPPVNAFWSLTMYNLPHQLLVKNPINRYLINSPMLPSLKRDADGGITLYIQAESPGKDKQANWLPAPAGAFMATLRFYWPKPELLDGSWSVPPITRAD